MRCRKPGREGRGEEGDEGSTLARGLDRRRGEGGLQQREPASGGAYFTLFCQLGRDEPGGPS